MKTFTGNRPVSQVEQMLTDQGFNHDYSDFERGGDYRFFTAGTICGQLIPFLAIGTNGRFIVYLPDGNVYTHLSSEADSKRWYSQLLDIVYLSDRTESK